MSSNNVRRFVKEYQPIEIKEPFKTDVIEFSTTDDFTRYYREHEDEFDNMSTYKLNIKYKVPGYKLSKKGKKSSDKLELILVKDYHGALERNDNSRASSQELHLESDLEKLHGIVLELQKY